MSEITIGRIVFINSFAICANPQISTLVLVETKNLVVNEGVFILRVMFDLFKLIFFRQILVNAHIGCQPAITPCIVKNGINGCITYASRFSVGQVLLAVAGFRIHNCKAIICANP